MEMTETMKRAASVVTAIGVIGGGAFYLDTRHASAEKVMKMEASGRVQTIFNLVDQAQRDGPAPWLCRAIAAEFVALCTDMPQHYLCTDPEAQDELLAKAGCQ